MANDYCEHFFHKGEISRGQLAKKRTYITKGQKMCQQNRVSEEDDDVDQVLEAIGVWGEWQSKMFYLLGLVIIPGCFQILVLTFVNANQVIMVSLHLSKRF
jgi:hypothetical protein